jgi:aspartate aminotransferase-like enzyme
MLRMFRVGQYLFKWAEAVAEFEQVHRLNYRTFVGEIPQYPDPGTGQLVDKFHHKNRYLIAVKEGKVVGMVSAHDEPPFSVTERLSDPGLIQRPGMNPLEVRLLAIEPTERNTSMFLGLVWSLYVHAQETGHTHIIISGVASRAKMYERLGFVSLGPAVASGGASFVPMMLTVGQIPKRMQQLKANWETHLDRLVKRNGTDEWAEGGSSFAEETNQGPARAKEASLAPSSSETPPTKSDHRPARICLLPGPVTVSQAVRDAFHEPPIYHRGPEFIRRFVQIRNALGDLVGGRSVAILNGSGTLANEAVAATLAALPAPGRGVMLVNGEFGQRLAKQALRFGLTPRVLNWAWGQPWDLDEVDAALAQEPAGSWVWGVHLESSTGVLNDLAGLVALARRRGTRVCMDCISSLGAVPLDLRGVFLATGSTGKSLGAYAGAALIFADGEAAARLERSRVPSYFDLAAALSSQGPCYTFPSPILVALEAALQEYATPQRAQAAYGRYAELGAYVRRQLRRLGLEPLAREDCAAPVVATFAPPGELRSEEFVERCLSWGIAIGGQSGYLAERRLVQIATMGAVTREACAALFQHLEAWLRPEPALATR